MNIIDTYFSVTDAILCDKSPEKSVTSMPKTSGGGGFAVGILGSPQLYSPGQTYTITLEVRLKIRFTELLLTRIVKITTIA